MTVSIIIPVYNGANYLREAIDSALAQTYPYCEILVINDGSGDNGATEAIALSYGNKIRYFSKENGGVASALNLGIKEMRGRFFSWLSHDDVYLPDKCRSQVIFWQNCSEARAVVYSDFDVIDAEGRRTTGKPLPTLSSDDAVYRIWGESFLNGCSMLIPRTLLQEAGGFRQDLSTTQDYDLWLRLAHTASFRHLPDVVLLSRRHAEQGSRLRTHKKECITLFSAYVPTLAEHSRTRPGGFKAAAPLLAFGISRRIGDYGGLCAKAFRKAFTSALEPPERRMLIFHLLPLLPSLCLRLTWLQFPQAGRDSIRTVAQKLSRAKNTFITAVRDGGLRSALSKTYQYASRIIHRIGRVSQAVPTPINGLKRAAQHPLTVILDHDAGGGALAFREHFAKQQTAEGTDILIWQYLHGTGFYLFELRTANRRRLFRARTLERATAFVRATDPDTLFFNNIAGWPRIADTLAVLPSLCRGKCTLKIFLHDYFALCPAYPLLNRQGVFCGVPIPPNPCRHCLPGHPLVACHEGMNIETWRALWGKFLSCADELLAADPSVKELFSRVYPEPAKKIRITPLEPLCCWEPLPLPEPDGSPTIGIIGHITRHKGAKLVEDLIRLAELRNSRLRFVVIGSLESPLRSSRLRVTGPYRHENLPALLRAHGITVCLVPSPLPETFCYVAQEIEMLGLPLVCLDLGAQGARARHYTKGFPAPTPNAEGCLQGILQACNKTL